MVTRTRFSTENLRVGVLACLNEAVQLIYDVERRGRLFQAHTRWGKTDAVRLIAYCMNFGYVDPETKDTFPPCSAVHVLVTPGKHLVDQALDENRWNTTVKRFSITAPDMRLCSISSTGEYTQISPNGERFLVVTIQQLIKLDETSILIKLDETSILAEWVGHIQSEYGMPVVFHFDEVHFNTESKPWGDLVLHVQEYGAVTIGWTATPQRADNGLIPGARVSVKGQMEGKETILKRIRVDEDSKRWAILEDREVSVTDLIIHVDEAVTFSTGWNNKYILKIDPDWVDVTLDQLGIDGSAENAKKLSELSEVFIRKNGILRITVEDPITIRYCAKQVARAWPRYINPQVLVFSNSDDKTTKGHDRHAKLIKKIFQEELPSLSIGIDTGNADEPGAAMKKFENGGYDVLIVKRMGAVGWDVPRVMIVVDLSVERTAARCMQAWMRGATLIGDAVVFTLILPQDAAAGRIFSTEVDREGGRAELKDIVPIRIREEEIEDVERPFFIVRDAEHGDFIDSDQVAVSREQLPDIDLFLQAFPAISNQYTQPEIANKLSGMFNRDVPPTNGYSNRTDKEILDLRSSVTENMKGYAEATDVYDDNRKPQWVVHCQQCWSELRLRCGYHRFARGANGKLLPIKKIRDIELLEDMKKHSEIMWEVAKRENQDSRV